MNNFSKFSLLFLLLFGAQPLWAGRADWSFLPSSTIFKPLIGDPREPQMGLVGYLDQLKYEGQVGSTLEMVRYSPPDDTQYAWGLFASGYILLGEDGATFPMLDGDFYIGTYFSGSFGPISLRLAALHESTHLGDSFQTTVNGTLQSNQLPLFYSGAGGAPITVTYTRENADFTLSFQPEEMLRLYAGIGMWDQPLIENVSNPVFAAFGTEIYSPYWMIDSSAMRAYVTGALQWKGDQSVWDKEVQVGLQWKASKAADRAIRISILYYDGLSQFGQFYNVPDTHLALATFFDF
ncbi:MAG TPA: DUF1207 domain-containing protein [bacterium]|jgi:hypothetical protein|nr:DUF1207 domain-containing protein [bacterium]